MRIKKKNIIKSLLTGLVLLLLFPINGNTQEWGGEKPINFWDHWSININAGFTSYYGDLSYHDSDIIDKLNFESKPALGVMITKHFDKKFGISGQLLYGQMQGGDNINSSFETNIFEYNIQARLDFIRLILPGRNPQFGLEGFGGIGHTWFKSEAFKLNEDKPVKTTYRPGVPEFVYFVGVGMHYHIHEQFAVTTSLSLRHLQNDKLDQLVKNDNYDFYSYFSIGLSYYIGGKGSQPIRNKARLAHSSRRSR